MLNTHSAWLTKEEAFAFLKAWHIDERFWDDWIKAGEISPNAYGKYSLKKIHALVSGVDATIVSLCSTMRYDAITYEEIRAKQRE